MTDWMEQYAAALDLRDVREQAHKPYIDAYTALADRTAKAAAAAAATATTSTNPFPSPPAPPPTTFLLRPTSPSAPAPGPDTLATLRSDLQRTQKARSTLESQVSTLQTQVTALTATVAQTRAAMATLGRQKAEAERAARDRGEESAGRRALVTAAQDEMVALQLRANMAEQRAERVEGENRELVARWMKRVGEEAEAMNRDSRWE